MQAWWRGRVFVVGIVPGSVAVLGAAACQAVPDIHFVDEDARADGAQGDGSSGAPDTGLTDASPGACTVPSPGSGAVCCGTVWCTPGGGSCTPARCADCEKTACSGGDLCCAKPQGVLCKKTCP